MKNKVNKYNLFLLIAISIILIGIIGCGTSKPPVQPTVEEVFSEAMNYYNKKDYQEALRLFDVIKLQFSASVYADDAQFYTAEIYYNKGEYIMSAFHYSLLRKNYPFSEYNKTALFKMAMSFYNISPKFDRDQEYTRKAIQAFSEYQTVYPQQDSLYYEASKYIDELREKLAYREFFTAELYRKLYNPKSASIYYDFVIINYDDTKYYEPALFGKAEVLFEMKKYDEAKAVLNLYLNNFPKGRYQEQANKLLELIKELQKR